MQLCQPGGNYGKLRSDSCGQLRKVVNYCLTLWIYDKMRSDDKNYMQLCQTGGNYGKLRSDSCGQLINVVNYCLTLSDKWKMLAVARKYKPILT